MGPPWVSRLYVVVVILGYTVALPAHYSEAVLRVGVTLLRRLEIPLRCLRMVLGHAPAIVVQYPEVVLGLGIALFGGLAIPLLRLRKVLGHALAYLV